MAHVQGLMEASIAKTRALYLLNVFAGLAYIVSVGLEPEQIAVVVAVFAAMNGLGVTVTYHRYLSHRSFRFRARWLERLFTIFAMLSGSGSGVGWANIHRQHHHFSDKERDPHRASKGCARIMAMDYQLERGHRYIVDLVRDPFLMHTHRWYYAYVALYAAALFALFGLEGLMVGFCIPAGATMLSENFTNWINHRAGDRHEPTNVWWMNFFSFGDGWHKNHHDHPKRHTTSEKWWQIDPSGLVIRLVGEPRGAN